MNLLSAALLTVVVVACKADEARPAVPQKTPEQAIGALRASSQAKGVAIDLSEVKTVGRRVWLRAHGNAGACRLFQEVASAMKDPPDCFYVLCHDQEVFWNQVGWRGKWQEVATSESCD